MTKFSMNAGSLTKMDLFPMFKLQVSRDYPESEGWKVYNRFNWVSYLHDFVLQRQVGNVTERVVVEINTDQKITEDQFAKMRDMASRLEGDQVKVIKKVLLFSANASVADCPADIELCMLEDFLNSGLTTVKTATTSNKGKLVA